MPPAATIPHEILWDLKNRLESEQTTKAQRKSMVEEVAKSFSVHVSTVYRQMRDLGKHRPTTRKDKGSSKVIVENEMKMFCDLIAAIKIRTENKKNRHASTKTAINILETVGIEFEGRLIKAPPGLLKKTTINRYLQSLGLSDDELARENIITRFEATHSNQVWQFDLSVSDMKTIDQPPDWMKDFPKKQLMIYSAVDDKSGVCYQEYHSVSGEDVIAALRFIFNAMAPKENETMPFQGIPDIMYMDNGPIAKSLLFQRVLKNLGIELRCHYPRGKGGHKTASRAKGKVERPFRTVKEMHEILYKFHRPKDEKEANVWLLNYLLHYNMQDHRREPCSRMESWINSLPDQGFRQMCDWDRFTFLAREPRDRKVGNDFKLSFDGLEYVVNPELAGQEVKVLVGIFENDIYLEYGGEKFGPYAPANGVIPFNQFRSAKQTRAEKCRKRIEKLAEVITMPQSGFTSSLYKVVPIAEDILKKIPHRPFDGLDPYEERKFSSDISARKFIAKTIGKPLGILPKDLLDQIDHLLQETLERAKIQAAIAHMFRQAGEAQV